MKIPKILILKLLEAQVAVSKTDFSQYGKDANHVSM
jgi:hypothetical protein